jgi:hypothetical protein
LVAAETGDLQGVAIALIDLLADPLAYNTYKSRCLLEADNVLQRSRKLAD